MMPIVDPYVQLSQDEYRLVDYLDQISAFHILRLVAMQQPQEAEHAITELHYFHTLSNTRGYSGFPNAVVAYCDLSQPNSLSCLLEHDMSATIRGVHFAPKPNASLSWLPELALLQSRDMSLDLTIKADQCDLIVSIASQYPELVIVINVSDWSAWLNGSTANQPTTGIKTFCSYDNIYLKICGDPGHDAENSRQILNQFIDLSAKQLSYDRIMFSTGPRRIGALQPFEMQWNDYMSASAAIGARHREKLFRSNAIRVYQL